MADGHEREVEAVGVDLPADVDVLGIAGSSARDDRDVVEPVGPASRFEDADLDLSHLTSSGPWSQLLHTSDRWPLRHAVPPDCSHDTPGPPAAWLPPGPEQSGSPPRRSRRPSSGGGGRSEAGDSTSSTRQSSSIRVRAVAPQTVSPATSKNQTGNSPPGSPDAPSRPGTDQTPRGMRRRRRARCRETSKTRSTSAGLASSCGRRASAADHRGHHRVGRDGGHGGQRADHGHQGRVEGRPPLSPRGGRPSTTSSPGSSRPPGKAASP